MHATTTKKPVLLIVDDEDGPRQSLQVVLTREASVLVASSGREALELAAANPIDVAILDIRMPEMSGTEVLARLKKLDASVEVIMMTAYETVETAREALRHGAFDYLNKPFDVSDVRKIVRKALERRNNSTQVSARLSQLSRIQLELHEQKLSEEMAREKGEIYASVLHDINGPLTIISGFVQMIQQEFTNSETLSADDLKRVRSNLAQVTEQTDRCVEISRRYLGFLRGESAGLAKVRINQVLNDLKELLRKHRSLSGNTLDIQPIDLDVQPSINGTDLIQILLNLTINALQATHDPHSVTVSGQVLQKGLDLDAYPDSDNCIVINRENFKNSPPLLAMTIEDNGPGIPPAIFSKIFEAYYTTKPEGEGTGLGLAIVARLLRRAHGALLVETETGKGTAFSFFLPVDT